MDWHLAKLRFGTNPVHFGEVGIGLEQSSERLRSDALFSAIASGWARLFGSKSVAEMLERVREQASFRLSSTFIWRSDGKEDIYYLPRPIELPRHYPIEDDLDMAKTFKKLNYLPLPLWQRWYQGEGFTGRDREALRRQAAANKENTLFGVGAFRDDETAKESRVPRIAVDRTTQATNLFHTSFVRFGFEGGESTSGLYFLVQFADESLLDNLKTVIEFLGEEGIGGERSSGAGRFDVSWHSLDSSWKQLLAFTGATHYCLLSLYWEEPLPSALFGDDRPGYTLLERGGWLGSPAADYQTRRKSVTMFAEGSCFCIQPGGQLANVKPERFNAHPVYRSGIALSLPIRLERP